MSKQPTSDPITSDSATQDYIPRDPEEDYPSVLHKTRVDMLDSFKDGNPPTFGSGVLTREDETSSKGTEAYVTNDKLHKYVVSLHDMRDARGYTTPSDAQLEALKRFAILPFPILRGVRTRSFSTRAHGPICKESRLPFNPGARSEMSCRG